MRKHLHGRFARPRRWRTWVTLILVTFGAVFVGGYCWLSRPQRIAMYAGQLLTAMTGADCHIDSADFSLDGTIDVRGLRLTVPGMTDRGAELFSAEQTLLRIDPWALLQGKFEAQQMILMKPTLSLTQVSEDTFNFELLRKFKQAKPTGKMPKLPRVYVRDGRVAYGEYYNGKYQSWGLDVAGRLNPDVDQAGLYHFELYKLADASGQVVTEGPDRADSPALRGRFDLDKLEVAVQLEGTAFVNPHQTVMPRQIRKWWEMFEPSGPIPNISFDYDEKTGPRADVHFENIALTLPQLGTEGYRARMTDVSGTFHFDNQKVIVEDLVGTIEGLQYRINGQLNGYSKDAPFTLALETRPFRIPEKPVYLVAMPPQVLRIFQMLSPVGWMRVSLKLERSESGGKIAYDGLSKILTGRELVQELYPAGTLKPADLTLLDPNNPAYDSHGHFEKFPYELTHCRGLITFNSQQIEVKQLTGDTPGGGHATITGIIGPPSADAAINLTVTAVNIPFDRELRDALPDKSSDGFDMFFNEPAYQRLLAEGHFVTSAQHAVDDQARDRIARRIADLGDTDAEQTAELKRDLDEVDKRLALPVYDLGGRGNAIVKVTRPFGPRHKMSMDMSVEMTEANVVFEYFPYPIRVREGRLIITPTLITFDHFSAEGLHGGMGGLVGDVERGSEANGHRIVPKMRLTAAGLPLDDLLFAAIPKPQDQWLRRMRLGGKVDVAGRILRNDEDKIDIDMQVDVADVTAAPGSGQYKLSDINGMLKLALHGMTIDHLTAHHDDGTVELRGSAQWPSADASRMDMTASVRGLKFEDPVLDLISPVVETPKALNDFWATIKPAGRFDGEVTYRTEAGKPNDYRLELRPSSLSFDFHDQRVALTKTTGRLIVTPQLVEIDALEGDFDAGEFNLSGHVKINTVTTESDLKLRLKGDRVTSTVRALAPPMVMDVIDGLKIAGRYDLNLSRLHYQPGATEGNSLEAAGELTLSDASMQLGVPITHFDGSLAIDAHTAHDARWPTVNLGLAAKQLNAAGRAIGDLTLAMANKDGGEQIAIPQLRATCGEGQLGGSGWFNMARGGYQFQLMLSEANLADLVTEPATPAPDGTAAKPMAGRLSASLSLEGSWRDATRLRGRGELMVRDAELYGLPLAVGILKVSHLALPVNDPFQQALVSYYVRDGRFVFERIDLASPTMRLAGSGMMQYPSGVLDLSLTSSNPKGLKLGPFTELVDGFRNQLMTLHITGSIDRPQTKVEQFSGVAKAWRDVFGEESPANGDAAVPTTP